MLYKEFLLCQNGLASATSCSDLIDNKVKHDTFTRLLNIGDYTSKELWKEAKTVIDFQTSEDDCLLLDNTIGEKPYSTENEFICWHYDHAKGRSVKGIKLISLLALRGNACVPVGYDVQMKSHFEIGKTKAGKAKFKRKANKTINAIARAVLGQALKNGVKFKYLLGDKWFASKANLTCFYENKVRYRSICWC